MRMLAFADAESLSDLGRYAARARSLDDQGAMRLQCVGSVVAAWVCARAGSGLSHDGMILGLRTFALAGPDNLDLCVPVAAIPDRTRRPGVGANLPVPPTEVFPTWAALSPPRSGWAPVGEVPGDGLVQLASGARERVAVETVSGAPKILSRVVGVAAYGLGFLTPRCTVAVHAVGGWTRLSAPGGYLLMR